MFGLNEALMSFIRRQVGLRTDTASASGSLHAKAGNMWNKLNTNLDTKVSQSGIKSVQRGVLAKQTINATSVNITISSVDTSKAFVIFQALFSGAYTDYPRSLYAQLTSSTNLQVTNDSKYDWDINAGSIAWQVVEFY